MRNRTVNIIFVVGSSTPSSNKKLFEENLNYGDILQINISESYKSLVLKSLSFFDWALTKRSFRLIVKSDADSYCNFSSIFRGLESLGKLEDVSSVSTIYGTLFKNISSKMSGFKKAPNSFCCRDDIFPDFTTGNISFLIIK